MFWTYSLNFALPSTLQYLQYPAVATVPPSTPIVPHSTPKNLTVPNSTLQIWGLQIGVVALPPSIKWSAD